MSNNDKARIRELADGWDSGILGRGEVIGLTTDVLAGSPDFRDLWADVPDWVQSAIWEWLKGCDDTTVLYNVSTASNEIIPPNLIGLRNWLVRDRGHE